MKAPNPPLSPYTTVPWTKIRGSTLKQLLVHQGTNKPNEPPPSQESTPALTAKEPGRAHRTVAHSAGPRAVPVRARRTHGPDATEAVVPTGAGQLASHGRHGGPQGVEPSLHKLGGAGTLGAVHRHVAARDGRHRAGCRGSGGGGRRGTQRVIETVSGVGGPGMGGYNSRGQ